MEWNGLIVDEKDWEPEQPQNYLRAIPDNMTVPDPRPEGAPVFLNGALLVQEDYNAFLLEDGSGFIALEVQLGPYPGIPWLREDGTTYYRESETSDGLPVPIIREDA